MFGPLSGGVAMAAAVRVAAFSEPADLFALGVCASKLARIVRSEVSRLIAAEAEWAEQGGGDGGRCFSSRTSSGGRLGRRRAWTQTTPCAFVCVDGGLRGFMGNGSIWTDQALTLSDVGEIFARVEVRFFPKLQRLSDTTETLCFGKERHRLSFICGFSANRKRWGERGADAVTVALLDRDSRGPCVWVRSKVFSKEHGYKVQGTTSAWPVGRASAPGLLEVRLSRKHVEVALAGVTSSFKLPPEDVPKGPLHFGFVTYKTGESDAFVTRVSVGSTH